MRRPLKLESIFHFVFTLLEVSKSQKQFFRIINSSKNERKTWKNYPKSSQDNFFSCFVRFLEELRILSEMGFIFGYSYFEKFFNWNFSILILTFLISVGKQAQWGRRSWSFTIGHRTKNSSRGLGQNFGSVHK